LPDAIRRLTETGGVGYRDWEELRPARPWWAAFEPRRFEEELARHGGSFTGREWLFDQVLDWARQPSSRLLLLTADAGFGKSAAAAQMTARLNVRGVHFCTRSVFESCQPRQWLAGLVYQLAAQFPSYRAVLEKLPGPPDWSHPTESLFRQLIADPLRQLRDDLRVDEPWVFVVDALDEAFAVAGAALADLLAESAARVPGSRHVAPRIRRPGVASVPSRPWGIVAVPLRVRGWAAPVPPESRRLVARPGCKCGIRRLGGDRPPAPRGRVLAGVPAIPWRGDAVHSGPLAGASGGGGTT
jgi:hypothetical protein